MTRKRFTRLLMGIGLQRNDINFLAECSYTFHKPYAKTWNNYATTLSHNLGFCYSGHPDEKAVLKDLKYLELHRNER